MKRSLQSDGGSGKFWEVEVAGTALLLRWGRLGTDGQGQRKDLGSEASALAEAARMVAEKLKKGYREVGAQGAAAQARPAEAPAPAPEAQPLPGGPDLHGGINHLEGPKGLRVRLTLVEGDFPDEIPLGTWIFEDRYGNRYENKVQMGNLKGLRWSPDGRRFALLDSRTWVYEERGGSFALIWHTVPLEGSPELRLSAADAVFSPDGSSLYIAFHGLNGHHGDACVMELDAAHGALRARIPIPGDYPTALALHPSEKLLGLVSAAHGGNGSSAFLLDRGGKKTPLGGQAEHNIAFALDGAHVAASTEGRLRVFDLDGVHLWAHPSRSSPVAWLPDGRLSLQGMELAHPGSGHISAIPAPWPRTRFKNAFLGPEGRWFGGAWAYPGRLLCWDERGRVLRDAPIQPGQSETAAMAAPDGRVLAAVNWQKKLLLFHPAPRFMVLTEEAAEGERFKARQKVFSLRAEAEAELRKQVLARGKKG